MAVKKYRVLTDVYNRGRIQALIDIPRYEVKRGDVGGVVAVDGGLSHEGDCWLAGNAKIEESGHVHGNAYVAEDAVVWGEVYGNAVVGGDSEIAYEAKVYDNAMVGGSTFINYKSEVFGNAQVYGRSSILPHSQVGGYAILLGGYVKGSLLGCEIYYCGWPEDP